MKQFLSCKRIAVIFMVILIAFSALMVSGCGSDDKYVKLVKQGSMQMEPDVKIGKAFDKFFSNGKWRSFKSTNGNRIVEFTGKCTWNGKKANCKIQFIITGETSFNLGAVSINDVDMNRITASSIVDKALTG